MGENVLDYVCRNLPRELPHAGAAELLYDPSLVGVVPLHHSVDVLRDAVVDAVGGRAVHGVGGAVAVGVDTVR